MSVGKPTFRDPLGLGEAKSKPTHVGAGHPRFHEILDELGDLHDRKNHDYAAGSKQGPLGNFHRTSTIMSLYPGMDWDSAFGVAMAYMLKQLDAAFVLRSQKRDSITGEPIPARLKDVATYSVIGMVIAEEEEQQKKAFKEELQKIRTGQ